MQVVDTEIEGLKILEFDKHVDQRGEFVKTYNQDLFAEAGISFDVKETFYSVSNKNVIRGMHFQTPPYDHDKVVHVLSGEVVDVVVDLRKSSSTFKKCMSFNLSGDNPKALFIPKGIAHGFLSLEDNTVMIYQVSSGYNRDCDSGILYTSISYDWGISDPIVSERDKSFLPLELWETPFK